MKRMEFDISVLHGQEVHMLVFPRPAPGQPMTDFNRKAIHGDIFTMEQLKEMLVAAQDQNESQELICHIQKTLAKHPKRNEY